jgi:uncharacterized OsmC-like protein
MGSTTIEYRMLPGTRAAVGRSGGHSVIADRVEGKHGGMGLGFDGGELLALAIGGCLSNDLQAIADQMAVEIADLRISVTLDFEGPPSRVMQARVEVQCSIVGGGDPSELIERAKAVTTIGNSLIQGIPVQIGAV